jgi:hypothetical protein
MVRSPNPDLPLAVKANLAMIQCSDDQIEILEPTVSDRIKLRTEFSFLVASRTWAQKVTDVSGHPRGVPA